MVKMSPKYGVNPSYLRCFWCNKLTGEIGLFGHIKDPDDENSDIKAKEITICGYRLCKRCKESFEKGVGIIEVIPSTTWKDSELYKCDPNRPEIIDGLIPTGRYIVLKESVFPGEKAGNIGFLGPEEFENILDHIEE